MNKILFISNEPGITIVKNVVQPLFFGKITIMSDFASGLASIFEKKPLAVFMQDELNGVKAETLASHVRSLLQGGTPRLILMGTSFARDEEITGFDGSVNLSLPAELLVDECIETMKSIPTLRWKNPELMTLELFASCSETDSAGDALQELPELFTFGEPEASECGREKPPLPLATIPARDEPPEVTIETREYQLPYQPPSSQAVLKLHAADVPTALPAPDRHPDPRENMAPPPQNPSWSCSLHRNSLCAVIRFAATLLVLRSSLPVPPAALGFLAAALLATAGPSWAETPEVNTDGNLVGLGIEQLLEIDVPTVSGVSRYDQKVTDAPASVSIVTADEIKKFGYRSVAEILRSVRSFYISYDRQYNYLGVRGFSPPGDFNTRILVLIDGNRLNNNVYDQAPIGTDFPLDIDLIERVEVIRGPSSSIYGSSAFFGVINIITRTGTDLRKTEVAVSGGSMDTYQGRVTYGNKFATGLELLFSGTAYYSGGAPTLYFPEFNTPEQNHGIAQDLDRDRAYRLYGQVSLGDVTLSGIYSARHKTVPTGYFETVFNNPYDKSNDNYSYLDLKYRHQFDDLSELIAKVTYNNYFYTANYAHAGATPGDPFTVDADGVRGEWLSGDVMYTRRLFSQHLVTAGVNYWNNFKQEQTYTSSTSPVLDDDRTSYVLGLYVQDEYVPFKSLILSLGVRYDYYSTFGSNFSPRAGLIYKLFDTSIFKLLYGQAFRAPNVFERNYYDGISTKGNSNLTPEKITTYELTYDQYYGEHLRSSLSGFYYQCHDLIIQRPDPADGLMQFSNLGQVTAKGLEAEIAGAWSNGLKAKLSYSYQNARNDQTNTSLPNSPRHLAKFNLELPVYAGKLFLNPEIQYYDSRTSVAGTTAGGFVITNLTLFSKELLPNLELSGSVYNLFDKKFGDPTVGLPQFRQDIIVQDGRTFRVKITYRF